MIAPWLRDQIKACVTDGVLHLKAERQEQEEQAEGPKTPARKARRFASFARRWGAHEPCTRPYASFSGSSTIVQTIDNYIAYR